MQAKSLLGFGFSLMEMMIVLLIVAIIAAASAPMVTKKMSRNAGTGDSPWVFTGLQNSIAYLGGDSGQVLIGRTSYPNNSGSSRAVLYIANKDGWQSIGFGNSTDGTASFLTFDPGDNEGNNSHIGMTGPNGVPVNSVMFGGGQALESSSSSSTNLPESIIAIGKGTTNGATGSIVIGTNASAFINDKEKTTYDLGMPNAERRQNCIAIGTGASAQNTDAVAIGMSALAGGEGYTQADESTPLNFFGSQVAIGYNAKAQDYASIAIGHKAEASTVSDFGIAIGHQASVNANRSIAIGNEAKAINDDSVAIGSKAETTTSNQIVLGTEDDTVYIPGRLVVDKRAILGRLNYNGIQTILCTTNSSNTNTELASYITDHMGSDRYHLKVATTYDGATISKSDRRLKNVGEKYTAGLDELKKLDLFHYTFKEDKDKTPHVGVIAQDLQEVFPDAVTEGEDGYLRIRLEDMFYAVINAVKELDTKITAIIEDITGMKTTIEKQQKVIEELKKQNEEFEKKNAEFEKRLKKLEKRNTKQTVD